MTVDTHDQSVFVLYGNCLPVKGAERSLLCDLQHSRLKLIPNDLYQILTVHRGRSRTAIKNHFKNQFDAIIDEYFDFLIEHDWGFWTDEPERWPTVSLEYQTPNRMTNAILNLNAHSDYDLPSVLQQLEELGCEVVQVRAFHAVDLHALHQLVRYFDRSSFRTVDMVLGYHPSLLEAQITELCQSQPRLCQLQIHSAPFTKAFRARSDVSFMGLVLFSQEKVDSHHHCGIVDRGYFSVNLQMVAESHHFNNCLNRKLSVDTQGFIRNCPSMTQAFGHVSTVPLADALDRPEFQEVWTAKKDHIEVCKDCEFRYVCPDCRAFISDPANPLSKPAKCSYDPYTATWKDAQSCSFLEV